MFESTQILFPTDLSLMCGAFAWQVTALASRLNANLTLLHIESEAQNHRRHQLSDFSALIGEQLAPHRVNRKVIRGDVASNIIHEASLESTDLIMIPSSERRGFRRFFEKPMVEQTLRQSNCAVWTANTYQAASFAQFRNILCAVDLKSDSQRVLSTASQLADQLNANLSVVHVLPELDESLLHFSAMHDLPDIFFEPEVHEEISRMSQGQNRLETYVEHASVPAGIQRVLNRTNADLLIIGPGRSSGGFGRLGTHVMPLVRSAPCPVLVLGKPSSLDLFRLKTDPTASFEAVGGGFIGSV